jgi:hypothetical protein
MEATAENVQPFRIEVPDEQLADLRRRITATKWPDREIDPRAVVELVEAAASTIAGTSVGAGTPA